jgi:hypothetical protein
MTLTHRAGVDIEELDKSEVANVPCDAMTGLKAFVVARADRYRCAEGDHLAVGPIYSQVMGACSPLWHDDA